jgi:hypothetical protein
MPRDSALDAAVATRRNLRDQLLATWPELADDTETLTDTLAGIDNFEEQCLAVLRHAIEREAMGKALGALIDGMQARKKRLEEGSKFLRVAVLNAMQEAALPKIRAPDMSVSIGVGKPKVLITNEAALPEAFCRITRAPDKAAIAAEIAAKRDVPGAVLSNPVPFLSVHRS